MHAKSTSASHNLGKWSKLEMPCRFVATQSNLGTAISVCQLEAWPSAKRIEKTSLRPGPSGRVHSYTVWFQEQESMLGKALTTASASASATMSVELSPSEHDSAIAAGGGVRPTMWRQHSHFHCPAAGASLNGQAATRILQPGKAGIAPEQQQGVYSSLSQLVSMCCH